MFSELRNQLRVDARFTGFIEKEVLPGTGIEPDRFWRTPAALVDTFGARNSRPATPRAKRAQWRQEPPCR